MAEKRFLFGSATSAHQTEGGTQNSDWYGWERQSGNITDGSTSLTGADSWEKWSEDLELLKLSGQNAYRFSIDWSKVEPNEGDFDKSAIDHYRLILKELRHQRIITMVTLFHFTTPVWFARKGGFEKAKNGHYFYRFVEKIVQELGESVDYWVTLNEPNVYAAKGYLEGEWYPGRRKPFLAYGVAKNLINIHNKSYDVIKSINPTYQVGCVLSCLAYQPANKSKVNQWLVRFARWISYDYYIARINDHLDFLGVNQYQRYILQTKIPIIKPEKGLENDYHWFVHPEAIYQVIKEQSRWGKPIFITENGIADSEDRYRPRFIADNLRWVMQARKEGLPVKGYFHWSLIDNFEWASGYTMKFGLYTIDRQPRKSATAYRELIKKYQKEFNEKD